MAIESKEITIEVVYALPREQQLVSMIIPQGTSARQGLIRAIREGLISLSDNSLADNDTHVEESKLPIGVYGELVDDEYTLEEGDRLEIYRPLTQDPKERRRRIARQTGTG